MPLCCPAPLRQGVADLVRKGGRFTPKGRPICSESLAFLLRDTQLKQHLKKEMNICSKTSPKFPKDRLLFCEPNGKPLKPNTIGQHWTRLLRRLNYPHIRFHDLRHTHASWMLKKGVSPKVIQERLGHSTISTTLDIYSHVTPGMQQQAVKIFDKILTRNSDKQRQLVTNTE